MEQLMEQYQNNDKAMNGATDSIDRMEHQMEQHTEQRKEQRIDRLVYRSIDR